MKWWPWRRRGHDNGVAAHAATAEARERLRDANERTAEVERVDLLANELTRRANWFTSEFERSLRRRRRGAT